MLGKPLVCMTLSPLQQPLSPLSLQRHPVFLPFLNRCVLYYLLRQCRQAGLDTIILLLDESLYCQLDQLRQLTAGLPLRIEWLLYSDQDKRWRQHLIDQVSEDDPVLLFQNPCLDLLNFKELLDFHSQQQADCSLRLSPKPGWNKTPVFLDSAGQVSTSPQATKGYDTRCYLLEPDIFEALLDRPMHLLRQPLLPVLLEASEYVSGLLSDKLWADWQTPEDFFSTQKTILEGKLMDPGHRRLLRHGNATVWLGEDVLLAPDVKFSGPVVIGDQVQIEAGVSIQGPTLIGSGSRIDANSRIESSWIWPGCRIAKNSRIKQCWLGEQVQITAESPQESLWVADGAQIQLSRPLPPGTVLGPGTQLKL